MQIEQSKFERDISALLAIVYDSGLPMWSESSFAAEFKAPHSHVFVAKIDSVIVAYIIFWDLGVECEIISIAVSKLLRRRKIASRLLEFAFDKMGQDKVCFLEVDTNNKSAVKLYEKHGFEICGTIKNYYGAEHSAYRMNKKI